MGADDRGESTRTLRGAAVAPIGLGCMGMSFAYTTGGWDEAVAMSVIRRALDLGVTLIDTADVYGPFTNEEVVGRALSGRRAEVFLATKGGLVVRDGKVTPDGRPGSLRAAVEASLRRLGADVIDLYYLHRVDPAVPLLESWGALAELVARGDIRRLGLSEVTVTELEAADAVHPVSAVQSELSLWSPDALGKVVPWCEEHGAGFIAYAPLGRGYLTGTFRSPHDLAPGDRRLRLPRFTAEAITQNRALVDVLATVAARHNATAGQVALAWVLAQGQHVVAIPGTKRREHLAENAAAARLALSDHDLAELAAAPLPTAPRY